MSLIFRAALIFLATSLLRWCVTYHPYSGEGKPPMYGDYEAQRHWQEITFNLPPEEWYTNTTNNDLQYWGLDYPPLTAYHSMMIGLAASRINPEFIRLGYSRGYESDEHKFFMRLSVILVDIIVYIPAVFFFVYKLKIKNMNDTHNNYQRVFGLEKQDFVLISILIYPGLILIDHGHFQYNCLSLGLFIAAVTAILQNRTLIASCLFTLALNYKQMELYHSLPFFFYILGDIINHKNQSVTSKFLKLINVGLVVLLTFAIIWSPFFMNVNVLRNVIIRLFPLNRGIFEDKVANLWCAINVVYKLRDTFSNLALAKICLVTTLVALIPTNVHLFFRPTNRKFILSLINTSLAFFLFSFHVHEKSILLVASPVLLYTHEDPFACFWFLIISNFSMLPLYMKDNLMIAYLALTTFYLIFIYWMFSEILYSYVEQQGTHICLKHGKSHRKVGSQKARPEVFSKTDRYHDLLISLFYVSMLGTVFLSMGTFFVEPPVKYPDLFPLLISVYSCGHFVLFFVYFNYKQYTTDHVQKKLKAR
ncbi:probable dolichyl pyrophosphate Man9GlcNAc2 alpha-1,3-glucosyltransferase [Athalia rosae]|uniref:probable dolichyl pyrophosphate Man9GlcNAc2 alpha-1,3-glucosyltransferase n=1 Tax=Athalia rosae TaxID=37344 RepID=UPI0020337F8A|nr:probable dolichyl pyrophosphate Man9GlcNAc2 alpha-1,3-glucosyltransferase [Athalia rosae]